jgi:hypothetical protein
MTRTARRAAVFCVAIVMSMAVLAAVVAQSKGDISGTRAFEVTTDAGAGSLTITAIGNGTFTAEWTK